MSDEMWRGKHRVVTRPHIKDAEKATTHTRIGQVRATPKAHRCRLCAPLPDSTSAAPMLLADKLDLQNKLKLNILQVIRVHRLTNPSSHGRFVADPIDARLLPGKTSLRRLRSVSSITTHRMP